MTDVSSDVIERARASLGRAHDAIYETVARLLAARGPRGTLVDVGCGTGNFARTVVSRFDRIIGVDAVRYPGLPTNVDFHAADLDHGALPLGNAFSDATVAIEVIEHLENPRALFRELVRVTRPGGLVIVSTPNSASVLSILTLLVKEQFSAFQAGDYPAHRTALLPIDLRRMARECGRTEIETVYTNLGRLPLTGTHYPKAVAALWPRGFSDNVVVAGRC